MRDGAGADKSDGRLIESVPFVRQKKSWCGPAALASVVRFWGKEISQEKIAEEIYLPSIGGTLNFDLENYPCRLGLWAQNYRGDIADLEKKIFAGFPLIILQKPYPILKRYHYSVVTGFCRSRGFIVVHSGRRRNAVLSYRKLERTWRPCGYWTLLVCPPENVDWELTPEEHNRLGVVFEGKGDADRAEENYLKAIAGAPGRAEYHFNLGNARRKKKSFAGARESYLRAIELTPDYADAYNNLTVTCLEEDYRISECREYMEKAIRLRPDRGKYYWDTLGEVYFRQGDFDAAEKALTCALELTAPGEKEIRSSIYLHLGRTYRAQGRESEAEKYLKKAQNGAVDN